MQLEDGSTAYIHHTVHMPQSNTILAIQADGTIADLQAEATAMDPETISVLEQYTTKVNTLHEWTGAARICQTCRDRIKIKSWKFCSFFFCLFFPSNVSMYLCFRFLISFIWNNLLILYCNPSNSGLLLSAFLLFIYIQYILWEIYANMDCIDISILHTLHIKVFSLWFILCNLFANLDNIPVCVFFLYFPCLEML